MKSFIDGNMACAEAVKLARTHIISAYPITPQTSIIENLAEFINDGKMDAEMVRVESEHSALSVCAGASLVGARTFTATSSQGLQLMSEVLYLVSGLRLPIVMAVPNRTLSAPVNIWCDHQDSLVNRDSGWIQIYASSPQEVHDYSIQAFKISESTLLPAMVCYDGFFVSHVSEVVDLLKQKEVDEFLPQASFEDRPILDPANPLQFGEVVYPDWYPEIEYKKHKAMLDSKSVVEKTGDEFGEMFGREYGLVQGYMCEDADIILVALSSIGNTAKWVAEKLRTEGKKVGVAAIKLFRPFPEEEFNRMCENAKVVAVLDRDIGYGTSGMVFSDVTRSFYNRKTRPKLLNFIVGLGGKDVIPQTILKCVDTSMDFIDKEVDKYVFWPDSQLAAEDSLEGGDK
jgi:pyruvate ferredoxin oxidoreductase alpha subunit